MGEALPGGTLGHGEVGRRAAAGGAGAAWRRNPDGALTCSTAAPTTRWLLPICFLPLIFPQTGLHWRRARFCWHCCLCKRQAATQPTLAPTVRVQLGQRFAPDQLLVLANCTRPSICRMRRPHGPRAKGGCT